MASQARSVYLNFCKRVLTDTVYDEYLREHFFNDPKGISESEMISVLNSKADVPSTVGNFWPQRAHTMIGLKRLDNLQFCVEDILQNNISGDFIETGVWRGGASIFMRLLLKEYKIKDRAIYVADSFEGLPKPDPIYPVDEKDTHYKEDFLKIPIEEVQGNFAKYGVLDGQVKFLKGWFKDTTKNPPFEKLAILRLDGDMYGSTWEVLENLYDKLSLGGYVIIDDYALAGCRSAVDDYRSKNNIQEPIRTIDWSGIFWKKGEKPIKINDVLERVGKYRESFFNNLMTVYSERPDLQTAFPEVHQNNLRNLLIWAGKHGIKEDVRLVLNAPLYKLLWVYCDRTDLQAAFKDINNDKTFHEIILWARNHGTREDERLSSYYEFFSQIVDR